MSMKFYYKSINDEFIALQDRITYLIGHTHHATTGGYQEALLRDFISKYIPENIGVSRGFIVFTQRNELDYGNGINDLEYNSNEIDILLYDKTRPTLYKSNDLVIVDIHSVKGIIEVKRNLSNNILRSTIEKFKTNVERINTLKNNEKIFSGIFAYRVGTFTNKLLLNILHENVTDTSTVINHLCIGENTFIKFWENNPSDYNQDIPYNSWHLYKFDENLAMGYFIYNLITYFNEVNDTIWFPNGTKEYYLKDQKRLM